MEVFGRQSFKREEELGWGGVHPSSACHLFDEMPSRYAVSEEEVLLVMSKEKVTREEALHLIHELRDAERRIDEKLDRLLEMFGVKLDGGINGAEEYNTFTEELTPTTEAVASPPPQESPSAPTKCSTVGLNIKGGTEQAMVVSLTNTCVSEGVPGSDAIVEAFSPRSFINSKLVTVMPTKCLIICEELSTGGEEDNVATNDWVEYTVATTRLTSMPTNFSYMWFNYTTIATKSVTALGSIHITGYAPLPSRTAAVAVYKARRELPKLGWSIIVQFKPIDLRPYTHATHLISVDWTISESCKSSCKITLEDGEIDEYLLYTKDQEFSYEQLIVHKEEFVTVYQSASFIKSKGYSMTVTIAASTSFTNSIPVPLAGQVWKEFSWTLYCWNCGFVRKLQFCFVVFLISVKQAAAMDILDRNLEESDPTRLKMWPVHPKYVQRQCINQSDEICLSAPDLQIPWDPGGSH
uniref:Uncharacterized protein n=1 Tax=Oryza barthii TaxID=65489 RepID=A0A0D3HT26_9ORYZ